MVVDRARSGRVVAHAEPHIDQFLGSEVSYRQPGEEWFFAVRRRRDPDAKWRYQLFHSAWAGDQDLRSRSPASTALAERAVLLVGVGAIGGTVARELARAGVGRLDLVDGDVCDPATSGRQYAPAIFAGYAKAAVLRAFVNRGKPRRNGTNLAIAPNRAVVRGSCS